MKLINEHVHHQQYGSGTIIGQTTKMVTVQFGKEYGTKKFLYPSAFDLFLELCDPMMKQKMEDEIKENRNRKQFMWQHHVEGLKRQYEEERNLLKKKHRASKKKSSVEKITKKPKKQPIK